MAVITSKKPETRLLPLTDFKNQLKLEYTLKCKVRKCKSTRRKYWRRNAGMLDLIIFFKKKLFQKYMDKKEKNGYIKLKATLQQIKQSVESERADRIVENIGKL